VSRQGNYDAYIPEPVSDNSNLYVSNGRLSASSGAVLLEVSMFYRDYHYIFDGWDEPPVPYTERAARNNERLQQAFDLARKNSPRRVMFELGLVIAAPLVLAAAVTILLSMAGISVGA
jgi:hypothetical protein